MTRYAIVIPATATLANGDVIDIASRFEGNSTIASGETIPRNALVGLPLHKVDLRLTKDIKLVGTTKQRHWCGTDRISRCPTDAKQLAPGRAGR